MKLEPFDRARAKAISRAASGLRGRHVRTVSELAEEFGIAYQVLVREMAKHPDGVPAPIESHSNGQNRWVKRYDLLLMRAWWKRLHS